MISTISTNDVKSCHAHARGCSVSAAQLCSTPSLIIPLKPVAGSTGPKVSAFVLRIGVDFEAYDLATLARRPRSIDAPTSTLAETHVFSRRAQEARRGRDGVLTTHLCQTPGADVRMLHSTASALG